MTINGIPLHPLVVHAAVVFTPIAALLGVAYLVPRWRGTLRWWLVGLGVLSAVLVWFAAYTGGDLEDSLAKFDPGIRTLIHHHEDLAGKLQASTWTYGALVIIVAGLLHNRTGWLRWLGSALVAICAVVVLVLVVLTGDAGAKAVWGGA
jgi:hypothetical protein